MSNSFSNLSFGFFCHTFRALQYAQGVFVIKIKNQELILQEYESLLESIKLGLYPITTHYISAQGFLNKF